jgi:hypothetical protein
VRYTIRAGIERDSWSVAIYPAGVESSAHRLYGTRANAEYRVRSVINRLLKEQNGERKQNDGWGPFGPARSRPIQRSAFLGYCCGHPHRDRHWFFYDAVHPVKAAAIHQKNTKRPEREKRSAVLDSEVVALTGSLVTM